MTTSRFLNLFIFPNLFSLLFMFMLYIKSFINFKITLYGLLRKSYNEINVLPLTHNNSFLRFFSYRLKNVIN